jgi:thiol-disulfide isomerase/thioredoxin
MRLAAPALAALLLPAAVLASDEVAVGAPAPSFSLRTLNGEASGVDWVALDRLVGAEAEDPEAKLVLVTFFASWCAPCKKELPFLIQLDQSYRKKGLRVIAVDIDREEPGISAARELVTSAKVTYPVCSDRFNILARRYLGEKAPLPSVFLIRRDGTLARIDRGYTKDAAVFLRTAVEAELSAKLK